MTSEENPAVALFKSSHDEMREVIKQNSNDKVTGNVSSNGVTSEEEDPAVTKFREYIRIETVQPNPDNVGAMKFLARYQDVKNMTKEVFSCACFLDKVISQLRRGPGSPLLYPRVRPG